LIRSFKKLYGKTPNQYLILVRINRAKELLRNDNSVLEVCFAVGFDSPTSFAGLFKKLVGSSPRSFKKS
jgi:AraC-like DNA-binding protein